MSHMSESAAARHEIHRDSGLQACLCLVIIVNVQAEMSKYSTVGDFSLSPLKSTATKKIAYGRTITVYLRALNLRPAGWYPSLYNTCIHGPYHYSL